MTVINIARDFTKLPGPRYITEGKHSGEEFRKKILLPKFDEAQITHEKLTIDLDGVTFGYPTSFLEESFGGLARLRGIDAVLNVLLFRSNDEPLLVDEIVSYVRDATKTSRERAAAATR